MNSITDFLLDKRIAVALMTAIFATAMLQAKGTGSQEKATESQSAQQDTATAAEKTSPPEDLEAQSMNEIIFLTSPRTLGQPENAVGAKKAMLGVHVRSSDETLRHQLGIEGRMGLVIEHVIPESAAAKAQLQIHDVLIELDGQLLANVDQFQSLVDRYQPGDQVNVEYFRQGKLRSVKTDLTEQQSVEFPSTVEQLRSAHPSIFENGSFNHKKVAFMNCSNCHQTDTSKAPYWPR